LAEQPGSELVFAGEGPLRADLEALARELGISEAVRFAGFLEGDALEEEWRRAHIALQASEEAGGDREGIPNTLLEAMARGLPPVATRHGGIPELIEDGRSGLLAGERDARGLAAALLRVAREPGLHARLAQGAVERVSAEFSPASAARQIRAIYEEAANCACPRSRVPQPCPPCPKPSP
ncbi:MAG: glycosyltransferase, partial [Terrimicrobiaceae bacterium]|nr:glycosyltransferase [Terrimicrobiaceae bacterium]